MRSNAGEVLNRRIGRRTVMSPFQFTPLVLALACVLAAGPVAAQTPPASKPGTNDSMPTPGAKSSPSPLQPGDAFGEQVTLPDRTIVYMKGHTNWDTAFDTLVDAFKSLQEYLDKQDVKPAGPPLTIYTQTGDTGAEGLSERRYLHRSGTFREGAQIRPSRVLRRHGFDVRSDH